VRWKLNTKGCFIVRSFHLKLFNLNLSALEILGVRGFPCQLIWRALAPAKVSFFVWEASHGKILIIDNLQKRGITLVNRCYMCKGEFESMNHLLLHCKVARVLWELAINCFNSIRSHLLACESSFGREGQS